MEESHGFPKAILIALRHVAEARAFTRFAEECKLNRETLYKTLSDYENPSLGSLSKMLDAPGLDLAVTLKPKKVIESRPRTK